MVLIVRNAGGVRGLHVAYDCFTEEVEERLFRSVSEVHHVPGTRTGVEPMGPTSWPDDYTRLCNLIKDCGLGPDLVPPNYCLPLMYPPKAGFAPHFDSRYRWGEAIMGVNLGQAGEMMFVPTKDGDKAELAARTNGQQKTARVPLPRRSIYVMTGPSRYDWKHGIVKQKPTDPSPSWNPRNLRKSLTLRSTKVFSDVYFQRAVQSEQDPARRRELLARQKTQGRFKAQDGRGERLSGDELQRKASFAHQVLQLMELGFLPADLRFRQREVTFPLPSGVPTATSTPNGNRRMGSGSNFGGGNIQADEGSFLGAASSATSSAAFQGEGHRLGNGGGGYELDDSDGGMQQAINASLRTLAAERAKRKQSREYPSSSLLYDDAEMPSPPKRGRKGAGGNANGSTTGVIDLASDTDEEEKKEENDDEVCKKISAKQNDMDDDGVIVID